MVPKGMFIAYALGFHQFQPFQLLLSIGVPETDLTTTIVTLLTFHLSAVDAV